MQNLNKLINKYCKLASNDINLSHLEQLSYSAIMREINDNPEVMFNFLSIYKDIFDTLLKQNIENPSDKALPTTLIILDKLFPLEL